MKYAITHVGGKRVLLTRDELKQAIDIAFTEQKQLHWLWGFSVQEMTPEEMEHEAGKFDDPELIELLKTK